MIALRPWKEETFLLRKYILEGGDGNLGFERAPTDQGFHILEGRDGNLCLERAPTDREFQTRRHEIAHGGNVLLDCQVLASLQNDRSNKLWFSEQNFEKMYGRPYNRLCQLVRRASPTVIKLYDIRANVRILDRWTMPKTENMQARAKDIGKLCSQSIGRWEEWIQGREGPAPEMEIAARAAQDSYDRGQW